MARARATAGGATLGDYVARRCRQGRALMGSGAALVGVGFVLRVLSADRVGLWLALVALGTALIVGGRRFIEVTTCPRCGERLLGSTAPRGTQPARTCASCGASFRLQCN